MSFLLHRERPIKHELKRVIEHQLSGVIESLQKTPGFTDATAVHDARKHVKKARAALRLTRGSDDPVLEAMARRLRRVNRTLGPIADARAVVETLDRLQAFAGLRLDPSIVNALREGLRVRAERLERRVEFGRVRARILRLLGITRQRTETRPLDRIGRSSVIAGVVRAHRQARAAKSAAFAHPSIETYHTWRRLVKTEWYLVRLIADHCGGQLDTHEHRLEALDGSLGDLHNVGTLYELVAHDSPLTRSDTAAFLLALRAYRRELRCQAHEMGRIYAEHAADFGVRLNAAWQVPTRDATAKAKRSWPRVA